MLEDPNQNERHVDDSYRDVLPIDDRLLLSQWPYSCTEYHTYPLIFAGRVYGHIRVKKRTWSIDLWNETYVQE